MTVDEIKARWASRVSNALACETSEEAIERELESQRLAMEELISIGFSKTKAKNTVRLWAWNAVVEMSQGPRN